MLIHSAWLALNAAGQGFLRLSHAWSPATFIWNIREIERNENLRCSIPCNTTTTQPSYKVSLIHYFLIAGWLTQSAAQYILLLLLDNWLKSFKFGQCNPYSKKTCIVFRLYVNSDFVWLWKVSWMISGGIQGPKKVCFICICTACSSDKLLACRSPPPKKRFYKLV